MSGAAALICLLAVPRAETVSRNLGIFLRGWDSVNHLASPGPTWSRCVSCVSCVSRCVSCVSCVLLRQLRQLRLRSMTPVVNRYIHLLITVPDGFGQPAHADTAKSLTTVSSMVLCHPHAEEPRAVRTPYTVSILRCSQRQS